MTYTETRTLKLETVSTQGSKPILVKRATDGCLEITFEGKTATMSGLDAMQLEGFLIDAYAGK
jgi:hypothetical protein